MLCEVCSEQQHKYTCPGCLIKTCSLRCVKEHKHDSKCGGKRDKTGFVPLTKFSDSNLLSDYRFLEETDRKIDRARRDKLPAPNRPAKSVLTFKRQAKRRGVDVKVLPYPLSRRKQNKSYYDYKKQKLLWHTEWVFVEADARLTHRFDEDVTLRDALLHFVHPTTSDPVVRQRLGQYVAAISSPAGAGRDGTPPGCHGSEGSVPESGQQANVGQGSVGAIATMATESGDVMTLTENNDTKQLEAHKKDSAKNESGNGNSQSRTSDVSKDDVNGGAAAERNCKNVNENNGRPLDSSAKDRDVVSAGAGGGGDTGIDLCDLGVFMRREDTPANEEKFYRLDVRGTLSENLHGKVVIEYPTIHVALRKNWSQFNQDQ